MRFLLTLLLFTCIAVKSKAQVIEQFTREIKAAFPSNKQFEKVLDTYRKSHGLSFDRISVPITFLGLTHHYYAIQTTDGFPEKIWRVAGHGFSFQSKDTIWETFTTPYKEWMLDVYADKDSIIYIHLSKEKENGKYTYGTLLFHKDTLAASRYIKEFNNSMGTSFSTTQCFYEPFEFYYGTEAGGMLSSGPVLNRSMEHIFKCVANRQIDIIRRFCKSASPEARTYGATGLYLLRKNGYKLNKEDKKIFNRLSRSKELINHYEGGCLIEPRRMNSILIEKYGFLKETHSRYLDYKNKLASKKE